MKTDKKIIIIGCVLIFFACVLLFFSSGVPGKRTYIGINIGKEPEIKDIAVTTEEKETGETEIAKNQEEQQEEFFKEMERIEKEHETIESEMAKRHEEEFLKEMERIEKEQEDFEEEHLTEEVSHD